MKFLLVFILSLSLSFSATSQQRLKIIDVNLDLFHLGDSIQIFRNQLNCADHGSNDATINLDSIWSCQGFRFMPAKKDPIQISEVKFTTVFLFPNGQKKIEVVDFLKNYLQTDAENPKKASSKEYNILIKYFDSLLNKKSKPTENLEDDYNSRRGKVWFKDNVKYVLVRTKLKKIIGSFRYMLDLSYTLIE